MIQQPTSFIALILTAMKILETPNIHKTLHYQPTDNFRSYMTKYSRMDQIKTCGRQPLKTLKVYGLLEADHTFSNLLKVVFHKFYLVHS